MVFLSQYLSWHSNTHTQYVLGNQGQVFAQAGAGRPATEQHPRYACDPQTQIQGSCWWMTKHGIVPQPVTEGNLPLTPQQASEQEGVNLVLLWAKLELAVVFFFWISAYSSPDL